MARDYGDVYNVQDLSDDELQQLVTRLLQESPDLDADSIDVRVQDGAVVLAGAVGTDGEKRVVEKVVVEVLGVGDYRNELVVGATHRQELPDDTESAAVSEEEMDDQLGGDTRQQSDTASHLVEDVESETRGTRDMQQSIQEGPTYIPPDRPLPDGYQSEEDH